MPDNKENYCGDCEFSKKTGWWVFENWWCTQEDINRRCYSGGHFGYSTNLVTGKKKRVCGNNIPIRCEIVRSDYLNNGQLNCPHYKKKEIPFCRPRKTRNEIPKMEKRNV